MWMEEVYIVFCSSCAQSCVLSLGLVGPMLQVENVLYCNMYLRHTAVCTMAGCDK